MFLSPAMCQICFKSRFGSQKWTHNCHFNNWTNPDNPLFWTNNHPLSCHQIIASGWSLAHRKYHLLNQWFSHHLHLFSCFQPTFQTNTSFNIKLQWTRLYEHKGSNTLHPPESKLHCQCRDAVTYKWGTDTDCSSNIQHKQYCSFKCLQNLGAWEGVCFYHCRDHQGNVVLRYNSILHSPVHCSFTNSLCVQVQAFSLIFCIHC